MKQLLLLTAVLLFLCSATTEPTVYICTGKSAVVYHSDKNCKGIKSCKSEIKSVTLENAMQMKRRPCKLCYKPEKQ